MGLFSKVKKGLSGTVGGVVGGSFGSVLGGVAGVLDLDKFLSPGVKGMSAAEKRALAQQKAEEAARRTRLLEGQQRRTRLALGSQGGARTLLYGGFTGTDTVAVDAPISGLSAPAAASDPTAARRRRRTAEIGGPRRPAIA